MTDYQIAIEGMKSVLEDPERQIQTFKRGAYPEGFQKFYLNLIPALDAIERLYLSVGEPETMVDNMAQAFTEKARQLYDATPKRNREVFFINQSLCVAAFLFPSIIKYNGESSAKLLEVLQKRWNEVFPKSNIKAAPYEDIEKGFHKKWCYITTAACQVRGMDDDCTELNILRNYRDTYMMNKPGGEELIREYYDIAPSIIKHIDMRPDAKQVYDEIWDEYISPCISDIREGKMEECLDLYIRMVYRMKDKYFHLYPHVKSSDR